MLYVPAGCAHGFVTLEDDTEALYFVSAFYDSERERGVRWDDPTFAVEWPLEPAVLSPKDAVYPNFDRSWHLDAGGNQR
jgi:dTDP-4-dehydrorhamnose 3,5-epimerase